MSKPSIKIGAINFCISDLVELTEHVMAKVVDSGVKEVLGQELKNAQTMSDLLCSKPALTAAEEEKLVHNAADLLVAEVEEMLGVEVLEKDGSLSQKKILVSFYTTPFKAHWRLPGFIASVNRSLRCGPYSKSLLNIEWTGLYSASAASSFVSLRKFPAAGEL